MIPEAPAICCNLMQQMRGQSVIKDTIEGDIISAPKPQKLNFSAISRPPETRVNTEKMKIVENKLGIERIINVYLSPLR